MAEHVHQLSDEQLMAKYQAGHQNAFTVLIKRYEKELYHFLVRFLGNASLAEESFQEAFLQVHISAGRFDTEKRFRPWLYTIAANKARDLLRSRAARPTVQLTDSSQDDSHADLWDYLLNTDQTPGDILDEKYQKERVRTTVEKLPNRHREILVLAYFNQVSYKDMADVLDIPLGTVKSRLHAAVKNFSQLYKRSQT
ncbi:MAG: sigma-70 family RNA polymerase sigma factor [Planctomycetes bacterium]|nr:sigma-70 family RNA polymerase sigma factor [Planctomycetota bacterium]